MRTNHMWFMREYACGPALVKFALTESVSKSGSLRHAPFEGCNEQFGAVPISNSYGKVRTRLAAIGRESRQMGELLILGAAVIVVVVIAIVVRMSSQEKHYEEILRSPEFADCMQCISLAGKLRHRNKWDGDYRWGQYKSNIHALEESKKVEVEGKITLLEQEKFVDSIDTILDGSFNYDIGKLFNQEYFKHYYGLGKEFYGGRFLGEKHGHGRPGTCVIFKYNNRICAIELTGGSDEAPAETGERLTANMDFTLTRNCIS